MDKHIIKENVAILCQLLSTEPRKWELAEINVKTDLIMEMDSLSAVSSMRTKYSLN